MSEWVKIGEVGVDAGLIWIGDPCYILHRKEKEEYSDLGTNWNDFCETFWKKADKNDRRFAEFNYIKGDNSTNGLGVCVESGYGDGFYDVEANFEDGRVKEVKIKFF